MYTWPPTGVAPPPSEGVEEKSPGVLRIIMMGYRPTFGSSPVEIYIRTLNLFSAGLILSNLSDVSVPKPDFHWEDCEEHMKKKKLRNTDVSIHPYKVIVV